MELCASLKSVLEKEPSLCTMLDDNWARVSDGQCDKAGATRTCMASTDEPRRFEIRRNVCVTCRETKRGEGECVVAACVWSRAQACEAAVPLF
jgi:hypothetical protein